MPCPLPRRPIAPPIPVSFEDFLYLVLLFDCVKIKTIKDTGDYWSHFTTGATSQSWYYIS